MKSSSQSVGLSKFVIRDHATRLPADYRLETRYLLPEMMDDPALDDRLHYQALAGLKRINWVSRCSHRFWPTLQRLARQKSQPLRVLDLATGGGDVVVALAKKARRVGVDLSIDGCDFSHRALGFARRQAAAANLGSCRFFPLDVFRDPLPRGYDVTICSLFLHHLTRGDAVSLLRSMAASSERGVLVSDLRRTRLGYALATAGSRLISRSPIVHLDGAQSVRAAWTETEARSIADEAGLSAAELTLQWPQRFLLSWIRP